MNSRKIKKIQHIEGGKTYEDRWSLRLYSRNRTYIYGTGKIGESKSKKQGGSKNLRHKEVLEKKMHLHRKKLRQQILLFLQLM